MKTKHKVLIVLYAIVGLIAAIWIPFQNVHYISNNFFQANINFWTDAWANPAARSVTIDIFVMYFAACFFIFSESKRLDMKHSWVFIVFGYFYAIAVTFPLFMCIREMKLAKRGE